MNKIVTTITSVFATLLLATACTTDTENINIQAPPQKSEAYYEALRAYKQEKDRSIAFGWFGGWKEGGSSLASRIISVPDSMDIISIWGKYYDLGPIQKADMKVLQEKLGTRILFTIFAHEVPEPFEPTTEGVQEYAKAMADTATKYNYDGIDLDYEPNYGGKGPLAGNDNPLMKDFVTALSNYFGPNSGTGKILSIDGEPYAVHTELAPLFDYGFVQSYSSYGDSDLQGRFNQAAKKGWKAAQYVFTENFEDWWSQGGSSYKHTVTNEDGTTGTITVTSLKGMALFNPVVDGKVERKGGCGTYHMEYEYNHTDSEYKYMREAIQIMNPSK
jgi:hypothetical protein